MNEIPTNPKNTKLKIIIDIISFIAVGYLFIIIPIWLYHDNGFVRCPDGSLSIFAILLLVDSIPATFGVIWLLFRYNHVLDMVSDKYPFFKTRIFRILFLVFIPLLILIFYRK